MPLLGSIFNYKFDAIASIHDSRRIDQMNVLVLIFSCDLLKIKRNIYISSDVSFKPP